MRLHFRPNQVLTAFSSLMEAVEAAEKVAVDARCCCEGYYATIRFVGEVPPAKGADPSGEGVL